MSPGAGEPASTVAEHADPPTGPLRWRRTDPRVLVDVVVAIAIGVLSVAEVASASADAAGRGERAADALAYALVIAGSVALVWRRRMPLAVLVAVCAVLIGFWLRGYGATLSALGLPALYAAAAHGERRRRVWWVLVLACAVLMIVAAFTVLDTVEGFAYPTALSMAAFLVAAIAAGTLIRNRERIFVDTERRAAQAEADRVAEAERAVASERSRIAREMHDVVAHGLSVVAVQAAAGREIIDAHPDKAAEIFDRIETVGRESLAELRRMLGVLRDAGDPGATLSPQPGIGDIDALVTASSTAGVPTELVIEGDRRPLAPGTELAAFRIVQEALTNVRKHAGRSARATVRIGFSPQALDIEVTDDGDGAASSLSQVGAGQGLIGMHERVEVYGGRLTSGPRPGGGFAVRATLPIAPSGAGSTGGERVGATVTDPLTAASPGGEVTP